MPVLAFACLAALLAAAPARAADEQAIDCPQGTRRVATDNPYEPFRCASAAGQGQGFGTLHGQGGFASRPRCPRGTRPVADPGGLQPYRCARAAPSPEDSDDSPAPSRALGVDSAYKRFSVPGRIAFDYPSEFQVQNAWKEEVPTLYLQIDDGAAGKPVTITVTRYSEDQSAYQEMSEAIGHDVDWLGAKDGGTQILAGTSARVTYIPQDTRSVYLPASKESYYSFVYSAPAASYETYLPAFTRLLKTLKLAGNAR